MHRIYLASASPRRRELLELVGFDVHVDPVDVDESIAAGEAPLDYVRRVARDKALAAVERGAAGADVGVAADTIVWTPDGLLFGKPVDPDDAARMVRTLAGRTHKVTTAYVIFGGPLGDRFVERDTTTDVTFTSLDESAIASYVRTDEPHDKAGSYAIQGFGAAFVERIDGSYSNVVGLPVSHVIGTLREEGILERMPWDVSRRGDGA